MNAPHAKPPLVLTIAGFDPSGGAGIIADIRTIQSFGCTPVGAITSITFQNSEKYLGAIHQTAQSVRAQVEAIVSDHNVAAVKIGMLPTADVVREVARLIREKNLPAPVVDPVMESTSGGRLMADDAFEVFVTELLPLARVVTPNIPEAEKLAGLNIRDEEQMRQAAARIRELGARAVLVKGGHLKEQRSEGSSPTVREGSDEAVDILDDDGQVTVFRGDWIEATNVRGTGCMLASAIASCLAQDMTLEKSVQMAKRFVSDAIQYAPRLKPDPVTLELTEIRREN
ncbi:MAG TPA: bifunctional hydroxymethylpyrimidine kinase/phosphomethylpyrimidine kinase [Pyrinomonadaceae bacterium]|nr:bifunctional hydroxymethylpyrimidine kinase/phosphomethylpyrimidine kinase [Pyrinomonadaceae bacterium]